MAREGRGIVATVWRNFVQSLLPKSKGSVVGRDHFGTTYLEIPAEPQRGKRRPVRWFQAKEKEKFDQEIPVEWEAWLRGRRNEPPSQEEIYANCALSEMKKLKAKELEAQELKASLSATEVDSAKNSQPTSSKSSYPVYEDLQENPETSQKKNIKK